ncbi:MAG: hypothetical protein K9K93_03375, partial [Acholeplasmataceae bacterium]|nr:hypothetical protein [Acholeplasmataceae bacterium]
MNQLNKRIASIVMALFFVVLIAGCVEVSDIVTVEFVDMPKTTYVIGESYEPFTVRVTVEGEDPYELSSDDETVAITGFNTDTVGSRTMVITITDLEGASVNFVYTVVNSITDTLFAGGTGTLEDPYQIENAQQLSNVRVALDQNYILNNDIDLSGIEWAPIGSVSILSINPHAISVAINEGFSGTFDGNDKTISNLYSRSDASSLPVALFVAIYGADEDNKAVVKDLTIADIDVDVAYAVAGLTFYAVDVHFSNITVSGNMTGRGGAGIANIVQGTHSIIENVTNNSNITSNSTFDYTFLGGIVAQTSLPVDGVVEINNATNNGDLTHLYVESGSGTIAGQILAQATQGNQGTTIIRNP